MRQDDIQDMRINLAIRQERKASMKGYWLLAALPIAGVFIGLVWAAFSPAPASPAPPDAAFAETATRPEGAAKSDKPIRNALVRADMVAGDKVLRDVQADLDAAGFTDITEQIRLYDSTRMALSHCRAHNRAGFEAARKTYERRNQAIYAQWEQKFADLRQANTPSADMSTGEVMASAATGKMARQAMATVAFAQFQLERPTGSDLSANACAVLRNEMQSGKYDLKRPKAG